VKAFVVPSESFSYVLNEPKEAEKLKNDLQNFVK